MDGILLLGWGTLLAVLDEVLNGLHGDLLQRPCEMLCMKLKFISGRVFMMPFLVVPPRSPNLRPFPGCAFAFFFFANDVLFLLSSYYIHSSRAVVSWRSSIYNPVAGTPASRFVHRQANNVVTPSRPAGMLSLVCQASDPRAG